MKRKAIMLGLLLASGAALFQLGCLGPFFDGLLRSGFPKDNLFLNLAIDIVQEAVGVGAAT